MAEGELLLEVRAEEIPARMLVPASRELATRLFEQLVALGLTPHEVEAGFTPRRLWVVLTGLPTREKDRETIEVGPPAAAAFDAAGAPTAAAEGFARKVGADVAALRRRVFTRADFAKTGVKAEGERVYVERTVAGRDTREVLATLLPRTLAELAWAKTMRWGSGTGPWVRPVHGVVALFDGEVVPFELFGVAAGRTSAGHPTLSPERFDVLSAADWRERLGALGIVPEPERRRELLLAGMRERAAAAGGRLVEDGPLLDKLAAICEIPGVLEGSFDEALLELPREVLRTSLADHQSALVAERPDGRLAPLFLTVMDRPDDPAGRVRAGNEWVVAARLADAAFFWQKDRSAPLEAGTVRLEGLSFHEKLGHYGSKRSRLDSMTSRWAEWARLGEEEARHLRRAVQLLKVDLTSEMVREFTSLQGVVGGIYAREDGEADSVWQAIYDQYQPGGADDPLPRGRIGRLVALADRADTLVGFFGLGQIPTGSKDPYGLRRAALGMVRLLLEGEIPLGLEQVARSAFRQHVSLKLDEEECWSKLKPFLEDRVRYLLGSRGFAHDEIEAGLGATGTPLEDLPGLERRVRAIHDVRERPEFLSVVLSFKRLNNILKDAADGSLPAEPDASRLVSAAEHALVDARRALDGELAAARAASDPQRALEAIGRFAGPLDRFFVEVLVMDPDPEIRGQRLALLAAIRRSIAAVADLSAVVVDKAELRGRASD